MFTALCLALSSRANDRSQLLLAATGVAIVAIPAIVGTVLLASPATSKKWKSLQGSNFDGQRPTLLLKSARPEPHQLEVGTSLRRDGIVCRALALVVPSLYRES
jgi:hypothetical protein